MKIYSLTTFSEYLKSLSLQKIHTIQSSLERIMRKRLDVWGSDPSGKYHLQMPLYLYEEDIFIGAVLQDSDADIRYVNVKEAIDVFVNDYGTSEMKNFYNKIRH